MVSYCFSPWYFRIVAFICRWGKPVVALGLLYVISLLRSLFKAILRDEIFTQENALLVRRIGCAVLI
jgi:hypothetical protein